MQRIVSEATGSADGAFVAAARAAGFWKSASQGAIHVMDVVRTSRFRQLSRLGKIANKEIRLILAIRWRPTAWCGHFELPLQARRFQASLATA